MRVIFIGGAIRSLLLWSVVAGCCLPGSSRVLCDPACAEEGRCTVRVVEVGRKGYACYASSDAACAASEACSDHGRCFATERGTCTTRADVPRHACAVSEDCRLKGDCTSRLGTCVATSDADCAASFECRTRGHCAADKWSCMPASDADCEQSLGCELEGACRRATYLGVSTCRVPLDDTRACADAWVCEAWDRCTPAPPAECPNCVYGHCATDDGPGPPLCTPAAHTLPECSADGRCAADDEGVCRHVPDPDAPRPAARDRRAVAERLGELSAPAQPPPAAPPSTDRSASSTSPAPIPPGPGAVRYAFSDLDGAAYDGVLTHATLLTDLERIQPGRDIDTLVLSTLPLEDCRPKTRKLLPLNAVWLLQHLPEAPGPHAVEGGLQTGEWIAKTWTWDGRAGMSHNTPVHGTIVIESRTDTEVRGRIEVRATPYFEDTTVGTLEGPFIAEIIACPGRREWPM